MKKNGISIELTFFGRLKIFHKKNSYIILYFHILFEIWEKSNYDSIFLCLIALKIGMFFQIYLNKLELIIGGEITKEGLSIYFPTFFNNL